MRLADSIVNDLRALGGSAPLRAVYEASKRTGFHSVLFREVRYRGLRSSSLGLGTQVPDSEVARQRCLNDASLILANGTRVFGNRVPTGVHAPWNIDPLTGDAWPETTKWWQIDIRTDNRLSDVKWVWEAARHRDLVILARASVIEPEGPWLPELEATLKAWLDQCRPERGVNWYSSLELALRAIAWAQMLELVGDRLAPEVRAGLDAQLLASGRHIMLELPYTVSSMKNNHLLGDSLGLVVLGRMFPTHPGSPRWQKVGDALFLKQLERHMHLDGSMIEDSLSYHRFVLEMLIVRVLLGQADQRVYQALAAASHHLQALGALEGPVPQYGDWDEGRVLADSQPAGSVAGSALAGLALACRRVDPVLWADHDELAWYVECTEGGTPLMTMSGPRVAGDFHVLAHGDWKVWCKTGTSPSHQHADIGAVWIQRNGRWITRDPGTGTYNGPLEVRNGFRTSAAHPVWKPRGADQLVPHRAFRWLRSVRAEADAWLSQERSLVLSVHNAFVDEPEEARVARILDVSTAHVRIIDFIERTTDRTWTMTVPLGDGVHPDDLAGLGGAIVHGKTQPFAGWHSLSYGEWSPSNWLRVETERGPLMWGIGIGETSVLGAHEAEVDGTRYLVEWSSGHISACVTDTHGATTLRVTDV